MNDDFELSRRKLLAGLGTAGVAAAGAGLGTTAYLNDTESFDGNVMTAGTLDLLVGYYSYYDQGMAGVGSVSGTQNGDGTLHAELGDVKPGDNGALALCPVIETNPAYLWLCGELTGNAENGLTEPEAEVDETGGDPGEWNGELAQHVQIDVGYCEVSVDDGEEFTPENASRVADVWSGTLADFLAAIEGGVALDGDGAGDGFPTPGDQACFAGSDAEDDNYCLCLDWWVPTSVGNVIQGDSLEFDLRFYAEQCRHNDGTANPCCNCGPDEVAVSLPNGTRTCVPVWNGEESVEDFYDFGNGSPFASQNEAIQDEGTTNLLVYDDGAQRSLVVVHDVWDDLIDGSDATGGTVTGTFTGLESSYNWQVRDDAPGNDDYDAITGSTATVDWTWAASLTDGGAIGPLAADFDVGVDLELDDGIHTVQYLTPSGDVVTIDDGLGNGDAVSTRIASCASEAPPQ